MPEELKVKPSNISSLTKLFLKAIPIIFAALVCLHICLAAVIIIKNTQLRHLNKKWVSQEPQRKIVEDFNKEYAARSEDALPMQQLTEQRVIWAQKLNKLSLNLPAGVWFNELLVSPTDFSLKGSVISLQKEEMSLLKRFIDALKNDAAFFKDFMGLEITSLQRKTVSGYDILDFSLIGALKSR